MKFTGAHFSEFIGHRGLCVHVFIPNIVHLTDVEGLCVGKFLQKDLYLFCRCLYSWSGCTAINVIVRERDCGALLYAFSFHFLASVNE